MAAEVKVSVREYARSLKIDEAAVRDAIKSGLIKKGYDKKTKKITPSIATKEWGFKHALPKPQRGLSRKKVIEKLEDNKPAAAKNTGNKEADGDADPDEADLSYSELIKKVTLNSNLQYSEVLRRKEILSAATDRMKLEELNGNLLRKDEVNKVLHAAGDQLKKSILNVPARVVDDVLNSKTKVEAINIMIAELNLALQGVANIGL